jgi:hypothetical protein
VLKARAVGTQIGVSSFPSFGGYIRLHQKKTRQPLIFWHPYNAWDRSWCRSMGKLRSLMPKVIVATSLIAIDAMTSDGFAVFKSHVVPPPARLAELLPR